MPASARKTSRMSASVILAADGRSSWPKHEQSTMIPLASAQPRGGDEDEAQPQNAGRRQEFWSAAPESMPPAISARAGELTTDGIQSPESR